MQMFIDGEQVETKGTSGPVTFAPGYYDNNIQWNIGRYEGQDGSEEYLTVDELRISNIARYSTEICEPSRPICRRETPFYYGGYFDYTYPWQHRVTTEYTNLTRLMGDYEGRLSRNFWLLRTRDQRIQYDIRYQLSPNFSDATMITTLHTRRGWLETRDMIDMVDMLYVADEPFIHGWSIQDMNRVSGLVKEVFPELLQVVGLSGGDLSIVGSNMPDTVDIILLFTYPFITGESPTYQQIKDDVASRINSARSYGLTQPVLWTGQAYDELQGGQRMPTPTEMKWQYQAIKELNAENPSYNIIGLQWWQLENHPAWTGLADNYFTTYSNEVQAHREIGQDEGFVSNNYTFVDLFDIEPNVGDGYTDGNSINGINGWVCDYKDTGGVWHYGVGVDFIITGAGVFDGLRVSRTVGRAEPDHPVSPAADNVVFTSASLGLTGAIERYMVIDIVGGLSSSNGDDQSTVTIYVKDSNDVNCVALSLSNTGNPSVLLPLIDDVNSIALPSIGAGNNRPFAVRLVFDANDGSLDILDLYNGVIVLAGDLQCYPGAITSRPDHLVLYHYTSDRSIFDIDAIQAFTNSSYPQPVACTLLADKVLDGIVDFADFADFAQSWLAAGENLKWDFCDCDDYVGIKELEVLVSEWLDTEIYY